MRSWEERSTEIAHLLNPAFCGEVLRRCLIRYRAESSRHFPYALAFLVLPIALHAETREQIPVRIRQQMHAWLQDHQAIRVGFPERARDLVPFTREAILFLLQLGEIAVDDQGDLYLSDAPSQKRGNAADDEVRDCYRVAEQVGRWFARAGSPTTIFAMWGVMP